MTNARERTSPNGKKALAAGMGLRRGEVAGALRDRLADRQGIRIVRQQTQSLDGDLHRYRPGSRVLHLSASLRPGQPSR